MSSAAPSVYHAVLVKKQKTLLRRYVDLAYLKEELIMRGVSATAAVGSGIADLFVGIATPIKAGVEMVSIGPARILRRGLASNLYAAINAMSPQQVTQTRNAIHSELAKTGGAAAKETISNETPDMTMLQKHIGINAAALVAGSGNAVIRAATGSGAAAPAVTSSVGESVTEVFVDFLTDSAADTFFSFIPIVGAITGGVKLGKLIDRVGELEKEILLLKKQGA